MVSGCSLEEGKKIKKKKKKHKKTATYFIKYTLVIQKYIEEWL